MPYDGSQRVLRLRLTAIVSCVFGGVFLLGPVAAAESIREQVEADWQRQDECRMAQIRQPGPVRFVETQLQWPGVEEDYRLCVPKGPTPKLDGRLDDPCWKRAVHAPPGPAEQPVRPSLRLSHDGRRFYVGASFPTVAERCFMGPTTAVDAAGAVDGIKNGKHAFHTGQEPNPWWSVDLGSRRAIQKIVVYNRLDHPPGIANAYKAIILISDDGRTWTSCYDNRGRPFGGVTDGKPLVVDFGKRPLEDGASEVHARHVRIQLASADPIFLHLDEVEIHGPADPQVNIALGQPAEQSSRSPWSRGDALFTIEATKVGLGKVGDSIGVTVDGVAAAAEQAQIYRYREQTSVEVALPLAYMPGGLPAELAPFRSYAVRLVSGQDWQIVWSEEPKLGFGKNRITLELRAKEPLDPPVEVTVESVVFTPARPARQIVFQSKLAGAAAIPVEFQIAHEGAAAVIVSATEGNSRFRKGRSYFVAPVQETLKRTERLAADFGISPPEALATLGNRLASLVTREKADGPDPEARLALYHEARWLARQLAFENPLLDFGQLFLVKRFTQETYPVVELNHMPWVSRPGGDICILSQWRSEGQPQVRNLLDGVLGPGHVHGADLWWDADRVVLGYAKAKSDQPPAGWLDRRSSFELRRTEEPTHLFEIGVDGTGLQQLTDGQWSDLDPTYLPNGDIAFVSERCAYSVQCNEYDKDETTCNLYVMGPDGSNIRQMSVSKDGDYLPHTLDDGTIAYTRWEYQERKWAKIQSIWTIRPDGTGADALFKQHLNDPWALEDVRSIPGSTKLVAIATGHHSLAAGPVVIIDPRGGPNNPAGIRIVTPGVLPPEGGMSGTPVEEGGVLGSGGFYMTPWALSEKSFLVSYSGNQTDPTGYAIYLIDVYGTKELIYRDPNISCFVPIPLRPRPRPPILPDATDPSEPYAVCTLQNVGYGVQGVPREAIRYVRISKRDQWPYDNEYGGQRYERDAKAVMINWSPARVIGTVPVEADGSACFRVPAETPVYFQLLDENHMELRRMRSFISFQPGEVRGCVGCHETRAEAPRADRFPLALLRQPRIPTPPPWGDRAISFLRDVQPVFDKHCVRCHGGLKPEGELDFSGGLTARYNRAYDTILAHNLVARSNVGDDAKITPPLAFGSHKSKLIEVLRDREHGDEVKLSRNEWLRLVTWIDANAPYHDGFINKRLDPMPYDLPADRELTDRIAAVHAKRCNSCHQPAEVTRADWIDIRRPRRSLFLTAPLANKAAGTARCGKIVYTDRSDPDYQAVLQMVQAAAQKAWEQPRRDLRALTQE